MGKNKQEKVVNMIDKKIIKNIPINDKDKFILRRRINKLTKDPIGFLEGSYNKRSQQLKQKLPIKHDANHNFTVVSAIYNVEKYLDEYFASIVNQSLNFKKYIQIICVDDGSTDNSAQIIKKWQKKYPHNIIYLYKENGGQASARNKGLEYLQNLENVDFDNTWVSFIDPDDFVNENYFIEIDKAITANVCMIVTNIMMYIENQKMFVFYNITIQHYLHQENVALLHF